MQILSKLISYIFHPVFMLFYIFIFLLNSNPYIFHLTEPKEKGLLIINVFVFSVFFPLVATFIMRGMGMIKSFEMNDRMERIGPFIVSAMFYLWLFQNIKSNSHVPIAFSTIVLGTIFGIFIGFAINTVSKISIHAIGVGGLLGALLLIKFGYSYSYFNLDLPILGSYLISINLVLVIGIIIAGLVGTARLILKAHDEQDIYGGYIVGIFSQLLSIFILL